MVPFESILKVLQINSCVADLSVFDRISMEIGWQYGFTPVFLKVRTVSRKYGNRDGNCD